jgi:hypothetical protein
VDLEAEILHRRSNYLFVTIGTMTSAQMSLSVASTWESGLSPTSPDYGTILLAILPFGFTNRTVRVGVFYAPLILIGRTTGRRSKVFGRTIFEIRFHHLHKVEEGSQQAGLVPVIRGHPSPEDDLGCIRSASVFFLFFFWLAAPYCLIVMALTCRVSAGRAMTCCRARLSPWTINF